MAAVAELQWLGPSQLCLSSDISPVLAVLSVLCALSPFLTPATSPMGGCQE